MEKWELDRDLHIVAGEMGVDVESIRPVAKRDLEVGKEYRGYCRNSDTAVWSGDGFCYKRYKFGSYYEECIPHYEDDDGSDVFVPVKLIENNIARYEDKEREEDR